MHEHGTAHTELDTGKKKVFLVGQANVGKSLVFSSLTGKYVTVSNYPGTTVEVLTGKIGDEFVAIDTPGISGVIPKSEDERIAFESIINANDEDVILHVGDAKNLKRTLLLALTLAESSLSFVIDLNMVDEAEKRGIYIDEKKISEILGVPVVKTVATTGAGIDDLKSALRFARKPEFKVVYDPKIEAAIEEVSRLLPDKYQKRKRFVSILLLSSNLSFVDEFLKEESAETRRAIKSVILKTQSQFAEPISMVIVQTKTEIVERIFNEAVKLKAGLRQKAVNILTDPALHPFAGFILILFVLYLLYEFVGVFAAGTVVDFIESTIFGEYVLPFFERIFSAIPSKFVYDLFMGDYGLISMGLTYAIAIVFPIVTAFFISFSILEDSGYLPRLAVLLNRSFQKLGLNGKAVVPIVLGLGCGTMATMVTRVLDTRREKIIATLLLALGIPCSAQLGVILGFFSVIGFNAFLLFILIIAVQLLIVGYLAARIIPGRSSAFVTEIPPYRIPQVTNIARKTYYRAKWYVKEAVPLFLIGTLILFVFDRIGVLQIIESIASPVVKGFLGLPPKAAETFILGFLRRDYGAAGLFTLFEKGMMDKLQAFVSMVVITLFIPCLANLLMIIKERGPKIAAAITVFVFSYAFFAGGVINYLLRLLNVNF